MIVDFMKKFIITFIVLLLCSPAFTETYSVERVIDATTLKLTTGEEVRLIGVDVPENGMKKATEFVEGLIPKESEVLLEFDVQEINKYGRKLAYVFNLCLTDDERSNMGLSNDYMVQRLNAEGESVNCSFLNANIVKRGYAAPKIEEPNTKYADLFQDLYEEAREQKRGLWRIEPGGMCERDADCVCAGNPDVMDGCGKPGQIWKCVERKCQLVFEAIPGVAETNHRDIVDSVRLNEIDACASDGECVSIYSYQGCCSNRGINKKFVSWYDENFHLLQSQEQQEICATIRCASDERIPYCSVENRCALRSREEALQALLPEQRGHYLQDLLYCEQDGDCAFRAGSCSMEPMNVFYDNSKLIEMRPYVECADYVQYVNPRCEEGQCVADVVGRPQGEIKKKYATIAPEGSYQDLQGYMNQIDFSCREDQDCVVKDVSNCCGYYPLCINKDAQTDPAFVEETCRKEGLTSACGYADISFCECVEGTCKGRQ